MQDSHTVFLGRIPIGDVGQATQPGYPTKIFRQATKAGYPGRIPGEDTQTGYPGRILLEDTQAGRLPRCLGGSGGK